MCVCVCCGGSDPPAAAAQRTPTVEEQETANYSSPRRGEVHRDQPALKHNVRDENIQPHVRVLS